MESVAQYRSPSPASQSMAEATDNADPAPATPLWLGWRILGIVLLSYFGLVLLLKFLENRFVYFPSPWPSGAMAEFITLAIPTTPERSAATTRASQNDPTLGEWMPDLARDLWKPGL